MSTLLGPEDLTTDTMTHEADRLRSVAQQINRQPAEYDTITSAEMIGWHHLDASARQRWKELRATQPEFSTPFFSLEFIDAVHAARGDVNVILMLERNRLLGMLPIHQVGRTAVPAGRFFNDAHNVVMAPDTELDWLWMLDRCGLRSFDFHALVGQTADLSSDWVDGSTQSFSASLGSDSIAFLSSLEREHKTIRKQDQKTRKMERELGDVRLEMDCRDPELLAQAIEWKRNQYRRTNILDLFTPDWTREMARLLHAKPNDQPIANCTMRGMLSVLRAGDEVVAMHYGMIEAGLLHYWFPVYNPAFSIYSPGTALFKAIVRESTALGIQCIDMGYGEQPYKRKQTDTITTVSHGNVCGSSLHRTFRRAKQSIINTLKRAPLKNQLKSVLRTIQPNAGIGKIK
ncbi:GNAT family N-acetyltransferase [Rubripirellula amarantea]|uniref:GNAT family N-acetyltransferase n=1 Tax=Rubripirellula amarantea TaxID=2527999 RepID=UPI0011B529C4|nr:GNAT family N-acetyltransferase [Rubripirellula amarantea]